MKMHGIIIKQGFVVIVAFCYNICLFKNPVITILKVVGGEEKMVREQVNTSGPGQFLQFFLEKNSHFNPIWMTF